MLYCSALVKASAKPDWSLTLSTTSEISMPRPLISSAAITPTPLEALATSLYGAVRREMQPVQSPPSSSFSPR